MKSAPGRLTVSDRRPQRRLRLMIGAQVFWLAIVCLLGAWWCRLVLRQAQRIAELESGLGMVPEAFIHQLKTHRMVFWESLFYFGLLIISSVVVFWLYWRDTQRSRGVQAFFASMTHELRTPLTSIRLQAESIADQLGTSVDGAQKSLTDNLVGRLLEDTLRLESQVERTLELARVEGGGPVFPESLELRPWLERLVAGWRDTYGANVRFELQAADVTAMVDPTALGVIMRNLVENSVGHAKPARAGEPLLLRIEVARSDDPRGGVELRFRDNGTAFAGDARKLGLIFEKGPTSQGTGVGLYLIRVLTEQMGGQARFACATGFETRLWLQAGRSEGEYRG